MEKAIKRCMEFLLAAIIFFTGCGVRIPDVIVQDSVIINRDGTLSEYIIEPFDRDRYEVAELYAMADKEAREYCNDHGQDRVKLQTVEIMEQDPSQVRVVFTYISPKDYSAYNEGEILYGQVKDYPDVISDSRFQAGVLPDEKEKLLEKHILITDVKAVFYCPWQVKYASTGVVIDENGSADTRGCEGTAIIILGK